jgi:phage gpG-like protein
MAEDSRAFADIYFESEQWNKILKKIDKKWDDVKNRKEFGGIISASVYQDIIKHFEEEKGPEGKWDSWSDAYDKHLKKIGRGGNKKLQFSGKLRQNITPNKWRATPEGILFYNNAKTKGGFPYAEHHDEGKSSSQGNPRSFMWLSAVGIKQMVDKINKWLLE